jgi:ribosomal protein S8E
VFLGEFAVGKLQANGGYPHRHCCWPQPRSLRSSWCGIIERCLRRERCFAFALATLLLVATPGPGCCISWVQSAEREFQEGRQPREMRVSEERKKRGWLVGKGLKRRAARLARHQIAFRSKLKLFSLRVAI